MIQEDQSSFGSWEEPGYWKKLAAGVAIGLPVALGAVLLVIVVVSGIDALTRTNDDTNLQRACPVSIEQLKRAYIHIDIPWDGIKPEKTKGLFAEQSASDARARAQQREPAPYCSMPQVVNGIPFVDHMYDLASNNPNPGCLPRKVQLNETDYAIIYYDNNSGRGISAVRVRADPVINQQEVLGHGQLVPGDGTLEGIEYAMATVQYSADYNDPYITLRYISHSNKVVMATICNINSPSKPECSFHHVLFSLKHF